MRDAHGSTALALVHDADFAAVYHTAQRIDGDGEQLRGFPDGVLESEWPGVALAFERRKQQLQGHGDSDDVVIRVGHEYGLLSRADGPGSLSP